jgi:hypothetical protein
MDAVSWFATGRLGDHPECACPVLTSYVISGQDAMPHERRQLLKPFIFRLIGSRDPSAENARTRHLVLAAARLFAPIALDATKLSEHSLILRSLVDAASFYDIARAAHAAHDAAVRAANNRPHTAYFDAANAAANAANAAHDAAGNEAHAAHAVANAAAHAASTVDVWQAYIETLDEVLNLGKQGDFDFDVVPGRLREFAVARGVRL